MKIIKLNATDSTNSYLKKLLNNKALDDLTTVISTNQTNGRGRNGKIWINEPNLNLAFSVFKSLKNTFAKDKFLLNIVSSISVYQLLKEYNLNNLSIKWPNDVMVNDKKVSGILIENVIRAKKISHTVIGVGININQTKFKELPYATSVLIETGKQFSIDKISVDLLKIFKKNFNLFQKNKNLLIKIYNKNLYRKDQISNFQTSKNEILSAQIIGVCESGELNLMLSSNKVVKYFENEIKMKI
tara:strand:- start:1125 stop:1853 length:729 start_codon:yes stop_codon:yes gene_type:complete